MPGNVYFLGQSSFKTGNQTLTTTISPVTVKRILLPLTVNIFQKNSTRLNTSKPNFLRANTFIIQYPLTTTKNLLSPQNFLHNTITYPFSLGTIKFPATLSFSSPSNQQISNSSFNLAFEYTPENLFEFNLFHDFNQPTIILPLIPPAVLLEQQTDKNNLNTGKENNNSFEKSEYNRNSVTNQIRNNLLKEIRAILFTWESETQKLPQESDKILT